MQVSPGDNFHDNKTTDMFYNQLQPELRAGISFQRRREDFMCPEFENLSRWSPGPHSYCASSHRIWGGIGQSLSDGPNGQYRRQHQGCGNPSPHSSSHTMLLILSFGWDQSLENVPVYPCYLTELSQRIFPRHASVPLI